MAAGVTPTSVARSPLQETPELAGLSEPMAVEEQAARVSDVLRRGSRLGRRRVPHRGVRDPGPPISTGLWQAGPEAQAGNSTSGSVALQIGTMSRPPGDAPSVRFDRRGEVR